MVATFQNRQVMITSFSWCRCSGGTPQNPNCWGSCFQQLFLRDCSGYSVLYKYFAKEFHEFLPPLNVKPFFLSPTDKNEIISIISALDSQKASGPNSIPSKILKLMKNDISDQLAVLFNLSFTSGSFPTILKISKVSPIYKDSKLKCSNYRPISLISNTDKILERIVYNGLYKLFEDNKLVYNLQFAF